MTTTLTTQPAPSQASVTDIENSIREALDTGEMDTAVRLLNSLRGEDDNHPVMLTSRHDADGGRITVRSAVNYEMMMDIHFIISQGRTTLAETTTAGGNTFKSRIDTLADSLIGMMRARPLGQTPPRLFVADYLLRPRMPV